MQPHLNFGGGDTAPRKHTIETRCRGANTAWKGWRVSRKYTSVRHRDKALAILQAMENPNWEYRAGRLK